MEIGLEPTNLNEIKQFIEAPYQLDILIRKFSKKETKRMIQSSIDSSKLHGFDLHELSEKKY